MDKCECKKITCSGTRQLALLLLFIFAPPTLQGHKTWFYLFLFLIQASQDKTQRRREKSPKRWKRNQIFAPPLFVKVNEVVAIFFFPIGVLWRLDMRPKLS